MNHSQEQDLCLQSCNISISFSADSTQLFTVLQLFLNSLRSLGPHVFLVFSAVYEPTVRRGATHRIAICWREKYCRLCALRIIDLEVSLPIRGKARFSVSVWLIEVSGLLKNIAFLYTRRELEVTAVSFISANACYFLTQKYNFICDKIFHVPHVETEFTWFGTQSRKTTLCPARDFIR